MTDDSSTPGIKCVVCQKRDPGHFEQVCGPCRWLLDLRLKEIPELLDWLLALGYVERDTRPALPPLEEDQSARDFDRIQAERAAGTVTDFPADPVAYWLTPGPISGASSQPRVSGSRATGVPALLDLSLPARHGRMQDTMVPAVRSYQTGRTITVMLDGVPTEVPEWVREMVHDEDGKPLLVPAGDQAGELPVATLLDLWCRDWITYDWCPGDHLPPPTVLDLAHWLRVRLEVACDRHPAIDDFAAELASMHLVLRSVNGLTEPPPQLCENVPCRRKECDAKALYRISGSPYIECGSCELLYAEDEYQAWVKLLSGRIKCPTCDSRITEVGSVDECDEATAKPCGHRVKVERSRPGPHWTSLLSAAVKQEA
jgi:hypothetical protein